MSLSDEMRAAYEATDQVLMQLEGLISALDVVEDRLEFSDHTAHASKAFHTINRLIAQSMAEIWDLRNNEWRAAGGVVGADT